MTTATSSKIIEQLNWRYATKAFDASKRISDADWQTLSEALRLSPSSYGLQPWKFIVVKNADVRKKLRAVSWNQSQIEDASHLIVFASLKKVDEAYVDQFIAATASTRGLAVEGLKGYRDMMVGDLVKGPRSAIIGSWAQRQTYLALGNLLTTAAMLEIDACPMEGLDPTKYDEILGLDKSAYATAVVATLGYRSAEDATQKYAKVRFSAQEVFQVIA